MVQDLLLTLAQVALYYGVLLTLFRFRRALGIGTFFCALCALTFAETYLAISVFVALGPLVYTPGSVILFAGKLPLLLLVYIREDAETVRQPIYGLLLGNLVIVGLLVLVNMQTPSGGREVDQAMGIIAESAWLSVWGTFLLFVDCIAVILLYERVSRLRRVPLFVRLFLAVAVVLTFDHAGFFAVLNIHFGVPISAGYGGFAGKMLAAVVYCGLLWGYLRFVEDGRDLDASHQSLTDVFGVLTYRQRFEALDRASRIDVVTRARNRRALLEEGPRHVRAALQTGTPFGLLVADLDHFKEVNDRHGHAAGDKALQAVADLMKETVGSSDLVYRIGGDEFVILLPGAVEGSLTRVAGNLRDAARATAMLDAPGAIAISIGSASLREDGLSMDELMATADRRLYEVKHRRAPGARSGGAFVNAFASADGESQPPAARRGRPVGVAGPSR